MRRIAGPSDRRRRPLLERSLRDCRDDGIQRRVELENPLAPGDRQVVPSALVDTGAALSWFPGDALRALRVRPPKLWRFRQADGTVVARWTAEVRVFAGG